jgi:hypothetical protein
MRTNVLADFCLGSLSQGVSPKSHSQPSGSIRAKLFITRKEVILFLTAWNRQAKTAPVKRAVIFCFATVFTVQRECQCTQRQQYL